MRKDYKLINKVLVDRWKIAKTVNEKRLIENRILILNKNLIHSFIYSFTKDYSIMEELKQIAYTSVIKSLGAFDQSRKACFTSFWAYYVHSKLSEFVRVPKKRIKTVSELSQTYSIDESDWSIPFSINDFRSNMDEKPLYSFDEMLKSDLLTEDEIYVLRMYYQNSLTFSQIGELMNRKIQNISVIMKNAISKIRKHILFQQKIGKM